jgi:hypothetical protein
VYSMPCCVEKKLGTELWLARPNQRGGKINRCKAKTNLSH